MKFERQESEGSLARERAEFSRLVEMAERELEAMVASLPEALRHALRLAVVILQDFPTPEQESEGVEYDQLGLFEGVGMEDPGSPQLPRITLWLGNLWELAGGDLEAYAEEVRVTFLHEVGHFLGLDEEDLEERDLG